MKTVVMTGGTSGFGLIAVRNVMARGEFRVILGTRGTEIDGAEMFPLDLTSLESVRQFADVVIDLIGDTQIDALVMNAGILSPDIDHRSCDGFEITFAVNHLAHYLLARLLLPYIARGGVMMLTTSGTHDPAEKVGFPIPAHANADWLAHPEHAPNPIPPPENRYAYASSKLCEILTARALMQQPDVIEREIMPIAFCPGQPPGTGLVRDMALPLRLGWKLLGGPLRFLVPTLSDRNKVGAALADLATGEIAPGAGAYYAAFRSGKVMWKLPSLLAQDDSVRDQLWIDSARLVSWGGSH